MPDTQVYVLDGKRYTVPKGTTMEELEKFVSAPPPQQVPTKTWRDRLKEGWQGPEKVKNEVGEGELATAPRFTTPGGSSTPLAAGISEAAAASSLGATSEIGTPRSATVRAGLAKSPAALREVGAMAVRTPTNQLRPTTRLLAHVAPITVGLEKSGGLGGVVGATIGNVTESLADAYLPKRRSTVAQQLRERPTPNARPTSEAAPPEVIVADVPRAAQPGVPPGSMMSTPREQLPGLILEGRAGAAEAHQASGGRVLFRGGPEGFPERAGKVGMPAESAPIRTPERRVYDAREGGNIYSRRANQRPSAMGELASDLLSPAEHAQAEKLAGMQLSDQQAKNVLRHYMESRMASEGGGVDPIRAMRENKAKGGL